ncbi:MAG: DNA cytosine methyltransferase, partial [Flavisolibacter sp.]|nr:DNA cytosine methyltransferase [Flavisolibacter sp.]
MNINKKLTYIDLFAGCGGLSLGLHEAGWQGLFAVEKNLHAFQTLKHNLIDKKSHFNWPDWLTKDGEPYPLDINDVIKNFKTQLADLKGKVDLVAGGPPCQGFSMAGRRKESDQRIKVLRKEKNLSQE